MCSAPRERVRRHFGGSTFLCRPMTPASPAGHIGAGAPPQGVCDDLATEDVSWSPAAHSPKAIGSTPMGFPTGNVDGGLGGAEARVVVDIRSGFP